MPHTILRGLFRQRIALVFYLIALVFYIMHCSGLVVNKASGAATPISARSRAPSNAPSQQQQHGDRDGALDGDYDMLLDDDQYSTAGNVLHCTVLYCTVCALRCVVYSDLRDNIYAGAIVSTDFVVLLVCPDWLEPFTGTARAFCY